MIFISHNHLDKIIIEPIALRLADIFGRDQVFYDSWSMQPGDGIIERMNDGLEKCTHFFFFVSNNSIKSNLVKMEWQNAIFKSSKGNCKVIPVRLDSTSMPAILSQNLYIDLYSYGLEVAISQIVNVIQGNSTFNAKSKVFSNVSYRIEEQTATKIILKIYADYFLEPIPNFLFIINNKKGELNFSLPIDGIYTGGFNEGIELQNGMIVNSYGIKAQRPITPAMPLTIEVKKQENIEFKFLGILHQTAENMYSPIQLKN